MEWYFALLIIFGSLTVLMISGMPIAFAFLLVNIIGIFIWWGGISGIEGLILSINESVTNFSFLPMPLFVLMGSIMFHSGLGSNMIYALDKWLGRLPGRLSLLAVGGGTLFATLSGSGMASVAMLGSTLVPEMEKRGYKKPMTVGPVLGSGGLAIMIPPSNLGVIFGALALISIGKILIAIIIPGFLMAVLYATYIVVRCKFQPHLAPPYDVSRFRLAEKLLSTVRDILPLGSVVFMVIGLIFLGVATPTEAAATGSLTTFILAAAFRRLSWVVVKQATLSAIRITAMVFLIITAATAFSQILAFSGASKGLIALILGVPVPPLVVILGMMVVLWMLGMFINTVPIMMITIPIFMPIVNTLGFDPVWFAVLFLLNMEMASTSPPFGLMLFVMKGIAPPDTTMGDCYRGALPFLGSDLIVLLSIVFFPTLALWLPGLMR